MALHTPLNTGDTAGEISQVAIGRRVAHITEDLAMDVSLWDRAYDTLANEDHTGISMYEDLLSRVLIRGKRHTDLAGFGFSQR
jgi:phosphoglycerate dehydrogenase-like enzyme